MNPIFLNVQIFLEKWDINPKEISDASYEQIFSQSIEEQIQITKVFAKILQIRNILLKQKQN